MKKRVIVAAMAAVMMMSSTISGGSAKTAYAEENAQATEAADMTDMTEIGAMDNFTYTYFYYNRGAEDFRTIEFN